MVIKKNFRIDMAASFKKLPWNKLLITVTRKYRSHASTKHKGVSCLNRTIPYVLKGVAEMPALPQDEDQYLCQCRTLHYEKKIP